MNDCGRKRRFLSCVVKFLRTKVSCWRGKCRVQEVERLDAAARALAGI